MVKRFADWLEKLSVGLILVSLFQHVWEGSFIQGLVALIVGIAALLISIWLTTLEEV